MQSRKLLDRIMNVKAYSHAITTKQYVCPEDLPGKLFFLGPVVAFYQDCLLLL